MGVRKEGKPGIYPLEIGTKNQKFLENPKSAAKFRLIDLIHAVVVYLLVWRWHCPLFWCHAVMSLYFTHIRSSVCWSRPLPNLRADCSTV